LHTFSDEASSREDIQDLLDLVRGQVDHICDILDIAQPAIIQKFQDLIGDIGGRTTIWRSFTHHPAWPALPPPKFHHEFTVLVGHKA